MEVLTDFPERMKDGMVLYVGIERRPLRMLNQRVYRGGLVLTLEGYQTPEEVGEFRNQYVFIPTVSLPPLPEGEYYHHQILGLRVVDEMGTLLGTITEILETGANDVYVVHPENARDILLPAIDPVILGIDLTKGEMRVHLLPGLIDE
jgi:16S rRNA processing protein RimM